MKSYPYACHHNIWERGRTATLILNYGTTGLCADNFTPQLLHPRGNIKLGGPQKQTVSSRHLLNGGFPFSFKEGVHTVIKSWNHRNKHSTKHHSMQNVVLWNQQYYSSITGFAYTGTLNE